MPVVDTIKQVDADGSFVVATPDRTVLRAVQTPQGFRRSVLERAHQLATDPATDDSVLVERLGIRVFCVAGSEAAVKITHPADLTVAERLLTPTGD
jgi:2-C-methyl-D-erythritol 4-phosphate cytidylyltransferase